MRLITLHARGADGATRPGSPVRYRLIADEDDAWVVQPLDNSRCPVLRMPKAAWERPETGPAPTIVPTVHRNGTSPEQLLSALEEARHACRNAVAALAETAPNGRDFYPMGDTALATAAAEHAARVLKVQEVAQELEAIAEGISAQVDAQSRPTR